MGVTGYVMAHRLVAPDGGRYFAPRVVLARLASAFAYVEGDEDAGRRHVAHIIRQLQSLSAGAPIQFDDEYVQRLKRAQQDSIYVYFGDDPGSELACLGTAVIPGEPLYFDYPTPLHQNAGRSLLRRCAEVLRYDIVDVAIEAAGFPNTNSSRSNAAGVDWCRDAPRARP